ncbi:MAG TPA: hypothetical protein VFT72_00595 [Opitutaceae bacterium]|nr:hypothetical protein [Opitutaceae bacterium]
MSDDRALCTADITSEQPWGCGNRASRAKKVCPAGVSLKFVHVLSLFGGMMLVAESWRRRFRNSAGSGRNNITRDQPTGKIAVSAAALREYLSHLRNSGSATIDGAFTHIDVS